MILVTFDPNHPPDVRIVPSRPLTKKEEEKEAARRKPC